MNQCQNVWMNGYSEDLRKRVVSTVESGTSKSQVARTFSVSLSPVKRYANKAKRGEFLAPKKSSGSAPKPVSHDAYRQTVAPKNYSTGCACMAYAGQYQHNPLKDIAKSN